MMNLKVLLPFQVLLEAQGVTRIVAETKNGSFGLWPKRLDGAAVLVPGIVTYEAEVGGEQYVAVDQGVLVKTGKIVMVSVRDAVVGGDLGKLRQLVEERFLEIDADERKIRTLLAKMEGDIIRQTKKLHDAR